MLSDRSYVRATPATRRWSAAVVLILVNAAVYALMLIAAQSRYSPLLRVFSSLALDSDDLVRGSVWQLITFQFLHGGTLHLIINCAMLYMFGRPLEMSLGRNSFLQLYFGSGVFGGLVQVSGSWLLPQQFGAGPVVGASAGVFGLIAAFAWLNRNTSITMLLGFIIPVSMKAKYLLVVEVVLALFGLLGGERGIAHGAHLGGLAGGVAFAHFIVLGHRSLLPWHRLRRRRVHHEFVGARTPTTRRRASQSKGGPVDLPPAEFISKEVDPILDKISQHGIQSLTERERRILELARSKMNRR